MRGFAPVSNPAISVAVVIDTPTVGTRYGAETSAPVFAEVAQQVLEYLGVPHDQPLKAKKELVASVKGDEVEEAPSDSGADLNAMFADVNSLPVDDPLRAPANAAAASERDYGGGGKACVAAPRVAGKSQGSFESPAREGVGGVSGERVMLIPARPGGCRAEGCRRLRR